MSNASQKVEGLESPFAKLPPFLQSIEPLSKNGDPNMTKNEHVYAICCPPEVGDDIISGRNVKTAERYDVAHLELASSGTFGIIEITIL